MAKSAAIASFALFALAFAARAGEPMRLDDPRPRWVSVRFEASPQDRPDRLATIYTTELSGRFEPGDVTGLVRVTIAGGEVESRWFVNQRLRPGSFSDYVWTFDTTTGDVVSARLRGTLIRHLDLGVFGSDMELPFEAEMTTRRVAGFEAARRSFGQLMFPLCERAQPGCTLVAPVRYDPHTGYVNAVGAITARAMGMVARTFSPLGEALFSEGDADLRAEAGSTAAR